jgi:hypothetical protein
MRTGLLTTRLAPGLLIALGPYCMGAILGSSSQASTALRHNDKQAASPPRVVSIQYTTGAGFCGCYCGGELQVNPEKATLFVRPALECQRRNPKKYREFKVEADFSSKHWRELEQLVDHDALFALPDKIGCPGCSTVRQNSSRSNSTITLRSPCFTVAHRRRL